MSSRLHSKYHRHNHHSAGIQDPRYPDAAHDPIASPDSPFLGDFVMLGTLSATGSNQYSSIPGQPAGVFTATSPIPAIQAYGNVGVTGTLSAANIVFTGNTITTYTAPSTSGTFLEVIVNGVPYGIRLWNPN
jgi:hypothetical protein